MPDPSVTSATADILIGDFRSISYISNMTNRITLDNFVFGLKDLLAIPRDGQDDAITCSEYYGVSLYVNQGGGVSFETLVLDSQGGCVAVAAQILNGTRRIYIANDVEREVYVLQETTTNSFTTTSIASVYLPTKMVVSDIDLDSFPDIVLLYSTTYVGVIWGSGSNSWLPISLISEVDNPSALVVREALFYSSSPCTFFRL